MYQVVKNIDHPVNNIIKQNNLIKEYQYFIENYIEINKKEELTQKN